MSQSTNSKTNKNTPPLTARITTNDKISSTIPKQGIKRFTSEEYDIEPDTKKTRHESNMKEASSSGPKTVDAPIFITASTMANNSRETMNIIPEISDEELLAMAIKLEMEHPQ